MYLSIFKDHKLKFNVEFLRIIHISFVQYNIIYIMLKFGVDLILHI